MKELRKLLGLTNTQMATLLNTNTSTYSMAESNRRSLPEKSRAKFNLLSYAFDAKTEGSINSNYHSHIQKKLSAANKNSFSRQIDFIEYQITRKRYILDKMVEKFANYNTAMNTLERVKKVKGLTKPDLHAIKIMEKDLLVKINTCDAIEQSILQTEIDCLALSLEKYKGLTQIAVQ